MSGDSDAAEAMDRRYGIEADYESIDRLCAEHGLFFPVAWQLSRLETTGRKAARQTNTN
jgi:hypothetical protein